MYCRQCHYDLRALTTNRCPECGETFDPEKPDTFYPEFPSPLWHVQVALRNFQRWCIRNRVQIVIMSLILWGLGVMICLPSISISSHNFGLPRSNLRGIMTTWIIQQNDPPRTQLRFDKDAARMDMEPSFSHWTEYPLFRRRRYVHALARISPLYLGPVAISTFIVGLLWGQQVRRIAWVSSALCILLSLTALVPQFVSEALVPGSYAFLDDYTYLDNIDLRQHKGGIAAYAWRTFIGNGRRMIAFDDRHIESLEDDRARLLFREQGIPYPEPKETEP